MENGFTILVGKGDFSSYDGIVAPWIIKSNKRFAISRGRQRKRILIASIFAVLYQRSLELAFY